MKQINLMGVDVPIEMNKRVKIRVTKHTQNEFHRMRIRGLTMIESAELGSIMTKWMLNRVKTEEAHKILEADESEKSKVIEQTLCILLIKK